MRGKFRYLIISMLTMISIVNYIDRGAIAYAQEFIIKEYGLNPKSWGQVLGFFGYGYIFGGLFGGMLADKKGPKFVWILIAAAWSLFEIVMGFAGDIGMALFGGSAIIGFAIFRILFGFAEGPSITVLNRVVANWAAPKEKAFLSSLGLVGVPIGALITAPFAVLLISVAGWKMMFVTLGAIGIIWAVVWSKIFTNYPENHPRVTKGELAEIRSSKGLLKSESALTGAQTLNIPWYYFFKNRALVLNSLSYFGFTYVNFLMLTWTPKYLQDVFHFNLSSLGYLGMIPWIGACITLPLGSKISDLLRRKTNNLRVARSVLFSVSFFLAAVFFLLILTVHSPHAALLLMSLGTAFIFLPSALPWAIIMDTEPSAVGTFGGVTHFIGNIASIIAPTLTGVLVMNYGYTAMFFSAGLAALFGVVCMLFVKPGKKVSEEFYSEYIDVSPETN